MVRSGEEEKIKSILTDPMLSEKIKLILTNPKFSERVNRIFAVRDLSEKIKAVLEKDHAIDCIFLLLTNRGNWNEAKKFMSDGTFRARMTEIENLGLAKRERVKSLKRLYVKTDLGEKVARLLLKFLTS